MFQSTLRSIQKTCFFLSKTSSDTFTAFFDFLRTWLRALEIFEKKFSGKWWMCVLDITKRSAPEFQFAKPIYQKNNSIN